jgi:hypothetical protein
MADTRSTRAMFSPLVFSQINDLIAQGFSAVEIAERIGCKVGSLRVKCSQKGISLRRRSPSEKIHYSKRLMILLPEIVAFNLQKQADKKGVSQADLALALLDAIARDNLYDAVIDRDGGPHTTDSVAQRSG